MSDTTKSTNKDHREFVERMLEENGEGVDWFAFVCPPNRLQIDYDHPFPYYSYHFFDVLSMLKNRFSTKAEQVVHRVYSSRSGNTHYLIELPENISDYERVAWQAAFGSDPKREAGNLISLSRKELNPILLIMRKGVL